MRTVGIGAGHRVSDRERMEALEKEVAGLKEENRELREKLESTETTANKKTK